MIAQYDAMPTLATADLAAARRFYEGTLGFTPVDELPQEGGVEYACGATRILLYVSAFAGTNRATALSVDIPADRFEDEVSALRDAGIVFDTFEMAGMTWDDGVATMPGEKAAWFRDLDGNILAVSCRV